MLRIAHSLVRSHVLWLPLLSHHGDRHVAHFSYDVRLKTALRARIRVARTLAWGGGDEYLELPHLGHGGSYHVDVQAPDGLRVTGTSFYFLYDRPQHGENLPEPPEINVQTLEERTHIYTADDRPGAALLCVRMMRTGHISS